MVNDQIRYGELGDLEALMVRIALSADGNSDIADDAKMEKEQY